MRCTDMHHTVVSFLEGLKSHRNGDEDLTFKVCMYVCIVCIYCMYIFPF